YIFMREAEIDERHKRYKEKKPLSKEAIIGLYVIIGAIFLFILLTKNRLLLFLFVTMFSAIVNYQTNIPTIRFNPDPEVFCSLLITRLMGFPYAAIMLLLPTLFVDMYTARLDKDTFISLLLTLAINYAMWKLPFMDFVVFGVILVTIRFAIGLVINVALDVAPHEILFEHVLGFVSNVIIFLSFGSFFLHLFT
ncbi:hypothetical protein JXC34_06490, partial [Candidatus Woesearchaeota archaeon]|nr:hypothetical protein [Candidatus Woesearchaeota archaeon]